MPPKEVQAYCRENGFTEPQFVDGKWWGFPPHSAIPIPLEVPEPEKSSRVVLYSIFIAVHGESLHEFLVRTRDEISPGDFVVFESNGEVYKYTENQNFILQAKTNNKLVGRYSL